MLQCCYRVEAAMSRAGWTEVKGRLDRGQGQAGQRGDGEGGGAGGGDGEDGGQGDCWRAGELPV
jgi:hypothetical protein